jgi:hypothetical protein
MSDATERTVVKTYVPAYQREAWDAHADELEMSRSEFVRSMVQAGRRGFERSDPGGEDGETGSDAGSAEGESEETGQSLETEVVGMLEEEPRDWEELLGELTADIEDRLEETLQRLQEADRVRYSGRDGGYILE